MAIKGRQFIFLGHRQAIGGAILHAITAEDAHPEIDRIVAQLFFLGGLVHHPIHHGQVDGTHPHANLAGDALIEFVVDSPPVALRRDQLFVGILHRDRPTAQVIEGDPQTLGERIGRSHRIAGVVADLLEEPEHGAKGKGRERLKGAETGEQKGSERLKP
ncbi:MAG: hypothetical protein EBU13_10115 [Synechococcaceae bacterium WB5_2A_257]|nr:hypothetical protein [Synechococcaceae bacterium WB5_2A_257]